MKCIHNIRSKVRSVILVLSVMITSCSTDSKMSALLEYVPEESDVVVVGNIKTILKSAGGSVEDSRLRLPTFILDNLSSSDMDDFDDFNFFLRKSGIDIDVCAIIADYKYSHPILLFSLADEKMFMEAIEENGYKENDTKDGITFYSKKVYESSTGDYDDFSYIAIKDSHAYWIERVWVGSSFNPTRELERIISGTATSSFSRLHCAKYITESNTLGVALRIPAELRKELRKVGAPSSLLNQYDGNVCIKGNLQNNKLVLNAKWFGDNGKEKKLSDFNKSYRSDAKINPKALSYFGKNESLIYAASIKDVDWDEYFNSFSKATGISRSDRVAAELIKSYLKKINGTIAFGVGLTNGMKSIFNLNLEHKIMKQVAITAVVETKEGEAKGMLNDMSTLLEAAAIPYEKKENGINLPIEDVNGTIHVKVADNHLIFSNHEIATSNSNCVIESVDFEDYIGVLALVVNKDNKLFHDLKVEHDIKAYLTATANPLEMTACIEVEDGSSNGIIKKIAEFVMNIIEQEEMIEESWREHRHSIRSGDNNITSIDSVAVDSFTEE